MKIRKYSFGREKAMITCGERNVTMRRAAESSSEQSTALCMFLRKGLLPYDHRHRLSVVAGNYQQGSRQGSRQDGRACRYPGHIHGEHNSQSQPSLQDPCHDDQVIEYVEGSSQEILLDSCPYCSCLLGSTHSS